MLLFFVKQNFAQKLCHIQITLDNVIGPPKNYLGFLDNLDPLHLKPTMSFKEKELIYFKVEIAIETLNPPYYEHNSKIEKYLLHRKMPENMRDSLLFKTNYRTSSATSASQQLYFFTPEDNQLLETLGEEEGRMRELDIQ